MSPTLYTLGRAELREGQSTLGALVALQPKRLTLLTFLALNAETAQSRDKLLALFWPDASADEGRAALRQALHHLRARLGDDAITSTSDGRIALQLDRLACDCVELQRAAAAGDDARVIELYRGEFLEGLLPRDTSPELEEWIDRQRRRVRLLAAVAAERSSRALAAAGRLDEAISIASRRIEIAPDDEDALRTLLRLLEQAGRAGDALSVAERSMREFEARLGVPASAETRALVVDIRTRRWSETVDPKNNHNDGARGHSQTLPEKDSSDPDAAVVDGLTKASIRVSEPGHPPVHAHTDAFIDSRPDGRTTGSNADAPHTRTRRFTSTTAIATVAVLLVLAAFATKQLRAGKRSSALAATATTPGATVAPVDRIVVADFRDNGHGAGAAVAAALRVDLSQSPAVRVLTGAQVRDAVRRAQTQGVLSLDDSVVRMIAVREGLKAFVTGEVNKAGRNWLVTAQLIDAQSGNALISVRETAEDSDGLIPAMERLSRALTAKAGATLSAQPAAIPLEKATTHSIAALRAYSEGIQLLDDGDREHGVALLEQAVRADSGFATAWRLLGSTWSALGEPAKSENALRRAFQNRERLTFRERYLVAGSYYRNLAHNYDSAITSYRTLLAAYPADIAGMNNLALVYASTQDHVRAESLFTRVVAADSTLVNARLTLAEQLAMQQRHADAKHVMDETARRFPEHPVVRLTPTYLAASAQDWVRAESLATVRLNSGVVDIQRVDAFQTLAQIEMLRGRVQRAQLHLAAAMQAAIDAQSPYRYLSAAITSSWLSLRYRDNVREARASLQQALARMPLARISEADQPRAALTELSLALGMKQEALQYAGGGDATRVSEMERTYTRGLLRLDAGNAQDAAAILTRAAAEVQDCAMCVLPALAMARVMAADTVGAIRAAEEYLASPYIHRFEPDAVALPDVLSHLAEWYSARGDAIAATRTWRRLLVLWQDADPSLAGRVADIRRRLAP